MFSLFIYLFISLWQVRVIFSSRAAFERSTLDPGRKKTGEREEEEEKEGKGKVGKKWKEEGKGKEEEKEYMYSLYV